VAGYKLGQKSFKAGYWITWDMRPNILPEVHRSPSVC